MLYNPEKIMINNTIVKVQPKGLLDHSDLDKLYSIKKMKNDSEMTEYMSEFREAKKNLREFERNFNKEMPDLKRLKQLREIA